MLKSARIRARYTELIYFLFPVLRHNYCAYDIEGTLSADVCAIYRFSHTLVGSYLLTESSRIGGRITPESCDEASLSFALSRAVCEWC